VIVGIVYVEFVMPLRGGDWPNFLGLAMYPALDAAIITLAALRVRTTHEPRWNRNALFLVYGMVCYGIANTINLARYVFSEANIGLSPSVFWILADAFLLIMALGDRDVKKSEE
jgi:hypothetical protein